LFGRKIVYNKTISVFTDCAVHFLNLKFMETFIQKYGFLFESNMIQVTKKTDICHKISLPIK